MANLDELKAKWEEHDAMLSECLRLNRELLTAMKLNDAESAVRKTAVYAAFEAAGWLAIVVWLGGFAASHFQQLGVALSAAAADVMCIGMLVALIRRIAGSLRIDYGQPVSTIQKSVEELRMLRIRTTQWGVLFGTVLWLPWLAVAAQAVFGVDVYKIASPAWLVANGLFGVVLMAVTMWVSKKYGERMQSAPWMRRLMMDLAGTNWNAAVRFVEGVKEFEREQA